MAQVKQSSGNRQTLTADGNTAARVYVGPVKLSITGSFGGGTAKLQVRDPSGALVDIANGGFTSATDTIFDFPDNSSNVLSVNVAGSTTPALAIWIQGRSMSQ